MDSAHTLWAAIYGATGLAVAMNSAATGLKANQRARVAAIQTAATTNSTTTPSEDSEILACVKAALTIAAKAT